MTNEYEGYCDVCGGPVPPRGGKLYPSLENPGRLDLVHLACSGGTPEVITVAFPGGDVMTQNKNGRCEDAPCCGCCS